MALIAYEFQQKDGRMFLIGKEELIQPLDQAAFDDASEGWEAALTAVKELAESFVL